jgi:small subunit ribosomal protein S11
MSGVCRCRHPVEGLLSRFSRLAETHAATSSGMAIRRGMQGFSTSIRRAANESTTENGTPIGNAPPSRQEVPGTGGLPSQAQQGQPIVRLPSPMEQLAASLGMNKPGSATTSPRADISNLSSDRSKPRIGRPAPILDDSEEPYHLHVYSHRHNTYITVTKPNRESILSVSCGHLGFKNSKRKLYDSAYQLGAYAIDRLQQGNWHNKINRLEIILRGFGSGREAVTKVLMSNEGRLWRPKVVRVSDATRMKFGGTRSKGPRRL